MACVETARIHRPLKPDNVHPGRLSVVIRVRKILLKNSLPLYFVDEKASNKFEAFSYRKQLLTFYRFTVRKYK